MSTKKPEKTKAAEADKKKPEAEAAAVTPEVPVAPEPAETPAATEPAETPSDPEPPVPTELDREPETEDGEPAIPPDAPPALTRSEPESQDRLIEENRGGGDEPPPEEPAESPTKKSQRPKAVSTEEPPLAVPQALAQGYDTRVALKTTSKYIADRWWNLVRGEKFTGPKFVVDTLAGAGYLTASR